MFIDPRPWVKRKPSPDFDWGIVLKESNKVIGMIALFDIQNARTVEWPGRHKEHCFK
jgi:ribosomal-protein-alanine N-acetyltransferase